MPGRAGRSQTDNRSSAVNGAGMTAQLRSLVIGTDPVLPICRSAAILDPWSDRCTETTVRPRRHPLRWHELLTVVPAESRTRPARS